MTYWLPDGTVTAQRDRELGETLEPPWLWGVTDQTEPSAPAWILDDAQWQAALDAQE